MTIKIPKQLQNPDFRFVLLGSGEKGKVPFEKDWANKGYECDNPKLLNHKGNYGVIGGFGGLRILDIDKKELVPSFKELFKNNFMVQTGSGGLHIYFISDYNTNHVLVEGLGELRAKNYQVVGAGSIHPNGNKYKIINDVPIQEIYVEDLEKMIGLYLKKDTPSRITTEGKDTSASGLEYRKVLALIRSGKTREEIYSEMNKYYKKWSNSGEDYQNITYNKAEDFVNLEKERTSKKEFIFTEEHKNLLRNKKLFDIFIKELNKKIEGEENSKKAIFLSLCSVWNKDSEVPLNSLVSSESSTGKSFICKNIIKLFPKEMVVYRTKITPEAFTYWKREEKWNWNGKICYLEDISQNILDAPTFKVMCSEGSTATIVIKQQAVDIEIQGKPVMLVTTARTNPNTEILNRFQIISLDESKEQTKAIVFRQAAQASSVDYDKTLSDSLKLLKRKKVFIPYSKKIAEFLNENYHFKSVRLRRDFPRLLDLIRASAVLHQYNRKNINSETIEANEQDYQIAREVINYIQTTTFKGLTHKLKKALDCCKELQEFTAKGIHSTYPFVTLKMWYKYLDGLCERGMLKTELKKIEESKKEVTYFSLTTEEKFSLPEFNSLPQKITINKIDKIDTKDTFVTINTKK